MPTHSRRFSGEKLKALRLARNMSRMDLVRKLLPFEMNPDTIIRYETGLSTPSGDRLLLLASALGVKAEDLTDAPR